MSVDIVPLDRSAQLIANQPRAIGRLQISSKAGSRLNGLHQSGAFKAVFPRSSGPLTAVTLNTAGGITGGDRFDLSATAGAESRLILTTQTAERLYKAQKGLIGQVSNVLHVTSTARLDWLPQETIVFDNAALDRRLDVHLAGSACFLGVECLVFGRTAMGEQVRQARLRDTVHIRRDGQLIYADQIRLCGNIADLITRASITDGGLAVASVIYAAWDASAHLDTLRQMMPATGGATLIRDGVLMARIVAADSFVARQSLIPVLTHLHGANLPVTWTL